ncbi:DNA cytosine methyltransferase [Dyella sp.]|uniref:DNA cytosine methyltransferase n=1 Tax=Dyella sp. TaxID=1869338 RepID=UPI002FD91835
MADGSNIGIRAKTRKKLIADLWCGAGGTITGAMRAAKKMGVQLEVVSVNHWPTAIETHSRNYPGFRHHCADLESARPIELVPEGYLDALIASPTCTYHSRARGGKPVSDQQRMDPWHVVRWCTELRVKRLLIENVPEFVDWGPCSLTTGRPIRSRKSEYFRAWSEALRSIGFRIDWRDLCCADFGDATTRQRFFLIGRSDGKRLRWPEPTHARKATTDLLGSRKQWRGAIEIIDWDQPGKSIFTRKKPLVPNTLRRILAGAQRYNWPKPYIDALQALLDGRPPVLDVAASEVDPMLAQFRGTSDDQVERSARTIEDPVPTISAGGTHVGVVMATASGGAARDVSEPVPTIVGGGNGAAPHFVTPLLMGVNGTAKAVADPVPTITTGGACSEKRPGNARPQLIQPLIVSRNGFQNRDAQGIDHPMPTATTRGAGYLADPILAPYYGGGSGLTALSVDQPVPAVTTKPRFGLAEPVIIRTDQTGSGANGVRSTDEPVHTIVSKQNAGLAQPFLVPNFGEREGQTPRTHALTDPLPTVTAHGHIQLAEPFVFPLTHHGEGRVYSVDDPLRTITGANRGELAIAQPATQTFRIDILYRMLNYRELARAMSFDDGEEVYDFAGNSTEITKQIGNAVPCRTAASLFRALMEDA